MLLVLFRKTAKTEAQLSTKRITYQQCLVQQPNYLLRKLYQFKTIQSLTFD